MEYNEAEQVLSVCRRCQRQDFSLAQFAVLTVLERLGYATVQTLQKRTGLASSSLYRHLDALCKRGLLERGRFEECRGKHGRPAEIWGLTDAGVMVLP